MAEQASASTSSSASVPAKRTMKRRRTRSHNSSPSPGRGFYVPGFEGQMNMSLKDLMDMAHGMTNMYLAHEIAVNKDFTIKDMRGEESPEKKEYIKVGQQKFWEDIASQVKETPPDYTLVLEAFSCIKKIFLNMLVKEQKRIIASINEKLDMELLEQMAEHGILDLKEYATYFIQLMAMLCCPARDEEVAELKTLTDTVPLFHGIFQTLEHMQEDLANFHLRQARPVIVSNSVQYEKEKFQEYLDKLDDRKMGIKFTIEWLQRHGPTESEDQDPKYKKLLINRVITDSYLELLEWDDYFVMPETLAMDQSRIEALRDQTERASVSTAVILVTFSNISNLIVPKHAQALKETIKKHIDILLEEFHDDNDLLQLLPNVSLQVVKDVNEHLAENEKPALSEAAEKSIHEQIAEMEDPNHKIRDLVQRRILEFNKQAISSARSAPLQIPPGLTLCQKELAEIAGAFVRLVNYNRAVFGDIYVDIIENYVLFKTKDDEKKREA